MANGPYVDHISFELQPARRGERVRIIARRQTVQLFLPSHQLRRPCLLVEGRRGRSSHTPSRRPPPPHVRDLSESALTSAE
jgi:hypothetical protein